MAALPNVRRRRSVTGTALLRDAERQLGRVTERRSADHRHRGRNAERRFGALATASVNDLTRSRPTSTRRSPGHAAAAILVLLRRCVPWRSVASGPKRLREAESRRHDPPALPSAPPVTARSRAFTSVALAHGRPGRCSLSPPCGRSRVRPGSAGSSYLHPRSTPERPDRPQRRTVAALPRRGRRGRAGGPSAR